MTSGIKHPLGDMAGRVEVAHCETEFCVIVILVEGTVGSGKCGQSQNLEPVRVNKHQQVLYVHGIVA